MSQNETTETQDAATLEESAIQREAKIERLRRMLIGGGAKKDEAKALPILEYWAALDDTDAMVMLAKCCALARGMEHNAERAEALLSDAAEKGNHGARILMQLINDWKGQERISLCLQKCLLRITNVSVHFGVAPIVNMRGKCMIQPVALAVNIVPCRELDLRS